MGKTKSLLAGFYSSSRKASFDFRETQKRKLCLVLVEAEGQIVNIVFCFQNKYFMQIRNIKMRTAHFFLLVSFLAINHLPRGESQAVFYRIIIYFPPSFYLLGCGDVGVFLAIVYCCS